MNEEITIRKDIIWKILTFVFLALFLLSLNINNFGGFGGTGNAVDSGERVIPPSVANPPSSAIKVQIDNTDPILGDKNAEISMVEFSDFQCPFCARAHDDAMANFKTSDYFKNGEVNLVYKHFPLNSIHPQAQKAAEASECANKQGKFWEYHDVLFANQNALDVNSLKNYASQVGLDTGRFNTCLDRNEATAKVSNDLKQATEAGGRGTPYFVLINKEGETVAVSGAQPWPNFESAIKSLQ